MNNINKKYINKWVVFSKKNNKIVDSNKSFEKLYSKLDDDKKDLVIKFVADPRFSLSP